MNSATAEANALASSLYSQGVASYSNPTFSSIFQIDKTVVLYPTCTEQVESFNVVFFLHNGTGAVVDNLVITEAQNLTVLSSSIQVDNPKEFSGTYDNANYEGYDAYYTGGSSDPVYFSTTLFAQPTPGYPSNPSQCYLGTCYVSTWTGIGVGPSSTSTGFVQDGTTAWCDSSGCSSNPSIGGAGYYGWYLLAHPGGGETDCSGLSIGGGDTIYVYSENDYYGGGNDYDYTLEIEDETSSTSCYTANVSTCYMGTCYITNPDHAYYITEDPQACGGPCTLATFGTVSWTDPKFYDWNSGSFEFLNTAYSNNDYDAENMMNGVLSNGVCQNIIDNIVVSSTPSTSGDFSTAWNSSVNTPWNYSGNCQ